MSTLYKEYNKLENGQEIKFSIMFRKASISWATSERIEGGYAVSVTPIQRTSREGGFIIESRGAFTGFNDILLRCERQGSKRLETAIKTLQERKEMYLSEFMPGGNYEIKKKETI